MGVWGAEAAPKIAKVWWWRELPKRWWWEQPKMGMVWWEFKKRLWWELPKGRDWQFPEAPPAVTETPEAVDMGIPDGPTS